MPERPSVKGPSLKGPNEVDSTPPRRCRATLRIPKGINRMSRLEAALAYAECGWYVVPGEPYGKNPGHFLAGSWHEKSSRDLAVIRKWYAKWPDASVMLHVGRSGAVVFDLDLDSFAMVSDRYRAELSRAFFQRSGPPW